MKILKGLFVYTILLIGIALAVGIVLVSVMFFTDLKLFGYGMVKNLTESKITTVGETTLVPNSIEMEVITKGFDVNITPKTYGEKTFVVTYYNNLVGLYKDSDDVYIKGSVDVSKDSKYGCFSNPRYYAGDTEIPFNGTSYDGDISKATKVVIELVEPDGFLQYGKSRVDIYIPQEINISKLTITTTAGDINIAKDTAESEDTPRYIDVNSLSITTGSGDLVNVDGIRTVADGSNYVLFDNMSITTNSGDCDLSSRNIVIGSSQSNNFESFSVNISDIPVTLKTNSGKFTFSELYGTVDIKGDNINMVADEIYTGGKRLEVNTSRGILNVKNIYTTESSRVLDEGEVSLTNPSIRITNMASNDTMVEIYTTYTSVNINYISGPLSIASNYGDINIGTVKDYADITSEHGDVHVKNMNDTFIIETTYGDITVDSYKKSATLFTSYGQITVTDATDAGSNYLTQIKSQDGNVYLNNAYAGYDITGTGKANIKITMKEFDDASKNKTFSVNTARGNIDVYLNGISLGGIVVTPNAPKVSGELLGIKLEANKDNLIGTTSVDDAVKIALTSKEGNISVSGSINAEEE